MSKMKYGKNIIIENVDKHVKISKIIFQIGT